MVDSESNNEPKNKSKISGGFDIGSELSALVANNKISSRIANRLEHKLKEKDIKITKEQLKTLVDKIQNLIRTYRFEPPDKKTKTDQTETSQTPQQDDKSKEFQETINKLQSKITDLESGKKEKPTGEIPKETEAEEQEKQIDSTSPRIVTTDDIKVPEKIKVPLTKDWDFDPLNNLPNDPENIIVLMKWLQYLIDKCGRDNLSNILDYYVDIGWISTDAKINLIDYSHGIKEESKKEDSLSEKNITDLPSKDHIQSYIFIQKLKGKQFDKHFIDRIDNEINRLTRKIDDHNTK
jgi:flagellar protein FlaD